MCPRESQDSPCPECWHTLTLYNPALTEAFITILTHWCRSDIGLKCIWISAKHSSLILEGYLFSSFSNTEPKFRCWVYVLWREACVGDFLEINNFFLFRVFRPAARSLIYKLKCSHYKFRLLHYSVVASIAFQSHTNWYTRFKGRRQDTFAKSCVNWKLCSSIDSKLDQPLWRSDYSYPAQEWSLVRRGLAMSLPSEKENEHWI